MLIDDYAPVHIDLKDHMPAHLIPGKKPHATNVPSVSYAAHTTSMAFTTELHIKVTSTHLAPLRTLWCP